MSRVTFTILGDPVPQGSKRHVGGGRMIEMGKNLKPWRQEIAGIAAEKMGDDSPWLKAVKVNLTFFIRRPKGHYGTGRNAHALRASSPMFPTSSPDLDKLVRAVLDALTGIVFRDDAQVQAMNVMKLYADGGERAGVIVEVIAREE